MTNKRIELEKILAKLQQAQQEQQEKEKTAQTACQTAEKKIKKLRTELDQKRVELQQVCASVIVAVLSIICRW